MPARDRRGARNHGARAEGPSRRAAGFDQLEAAGAPRATASPSFAPAQRSAKHAALPSRRTRWSKLIAVDATGRAAEGARDKLTPANARLRSATCPPVAQDRAFDRGGATQSDLRNAESSLRTASRPASRGGVDGRRAATGEVADASASICTRRRDRGRFPATARARADAVSPRCSIRAGWSAATTPAPVPAIRMADRADRGGLPRR